MVNQNLKDADFEALAEFRYRIRCFLRFSEQAARAAGIEPQQHQVLLAIRGLPKNKMANMGVLAERMQLAHHSTVELVDRLEERGLVARSRGGVDKRQVLVTLTSAGEDILARLSLDHLNEMSSVGPGLVDVLNRFVRKSGFSERKLRLVSRK